MKATICEMPERTNDRGTISTIDDGELLVRYAGAGDRGAFEEIVHRYEREIYNYLRKYLGDQHLAEDAFQATFLQLHRKCSQFEPGRELRPWLYRIAANQANDLLRRNRRHQAASLEATHGTRDESEGEVSLRDCLSKEEREPHELLESAEDCQQIASAVNQLPGWLKQPVLLVVYQGLKYRDAAKIIGIPLGTLKSRLYEAVRRIGKLSHQPAERRASALRRAPAA
jgi:RNA polymerase sigma-70 factor (ECF subfamily)